MNYTKILQISTIVVTLFMLSACQEENASASTTANVIHSQNAMDSVEINENESRIEAEEALKIKIAISYINDYVGGDNYYKDWVPANVYSSPKLKNELKRMIDAVGDSPYGLGYDPVVNGQDNAGEYVFKGYTPEGYIIAEGKDYPVFKVIIKVEKIDGSWLVNGIGDINISSEMEF